MINQAGGYLTDCGDVNLSRVQFILTGIGEVEDDIFKKRQKNEVIFKFISQIQKICLKKNLPQIDGIQTKTKGKEETNENGF